MTCSRRKPPGGLGERPLAEEGFLGLLLVLGGAAPPAECDGREHPLPEQVFLERGVVAVLRLIADDRDGRETDLGEVLVDDGAIAVRRILLGADVGEHDEVGAYAEAGPLDEDGCAVDPEAVGEDERRAGDDGFSRMEEQRELRAGAARRCV
jgi:hypothetical protein